MNKLFSFLNSLLNNDRFLKILSVLLAIIAWLFITNIASPTNEKIISKVPVDILYDGSTAEKNGLIMLMDSSELTVNITLEGPRSNLQLMTENKIKVQVNLDMVGTAGTYQLPLSVSLSDSKITVKEMSISTLPIEFAKKATIDLPVMVETTGTPQAEYEYVGATCTPTNITISGPEERIANIEKAVILADITEAAASFDITSDIKLYSKDGSEVAMTYLSLSNNSVHANINIQKTKIVPIEAVASNSNDCIETAYTSVICNPNSIKIYGSNDIINNIDKIAVGTIDIAQINNTSYSTRFSLPQIDGITYENTTPITVDVNFNSTKVKTIRYIAEDMESFKFINTNNSSPSISSSSLTVTVRGAADTIDQITKDTFIPTVDISDRNAQGQYKVYFYNSSDLNAGVIGEYYIWVNT